MTASLVTEGRTPYAVAARELLRDTLIGAARDELGRKSWADVTMADVATAAGVSRQTLYNEFGSRQKLAEALVVREIEGCGEDPGCRAQVARTVARVRRAGEVKILRLDSGTAYALGSATGTTRVAWGVVDRGLPVVQCVVVHRSGSLLAGHSITLRRLSRPIGRESSC